jgi:hypothetical protein
VLLALVNKSHAVVGKFYVGALSDVTMFHRLNSVFAKLNSVFARLNFVRLNSVTRE